MCIRDRGRRLLALDMASLVAGTKYRGDFEERFKNLLEELVRDGTAILLSLIHISRPKNIEKALDKILTM